MLSMHVAMTRLHPQCCLGLYTHSCGPRPALALTCLGEHNFGPSWLDLSVHLLVTQALAMYNHV